MVDDITKKICEIHDPAELCRIVHPSQQQKTAVLGAVQKVLFIITVFILLRKICGISKI